VQRCAERAQQSGCFRIRGLTALGPPIAALLLLGYPTARRRPRDLEEDAVLRRSAGFFVLAIFVALVAQRTEAASPQHTDQALASWIESLKQPGSGVSCCTIADCRPVDYRMAADGYEALLDTSWVRVPDDRIVRGTTNPAASAIICRSPISGTIMCFVPANEI
jgi:hypothetical protein